MLSVLVKRYMGKNNIIIATTILALIVVGMFTFTYIKKQEMQVDKSETSPVVIDETSPYGDIIRIDAKHFFINGKHTLAGEIAMPTPCDLLNWDTRILESSPEQVMIDFKVVNHAQTCAQVVTPQRFLVSFEASEQAKIRAFIMSREVELNLIPPMEGETPEDFELFIKG